MVKNVISSEGNDTIGDDMSDLDVDSSDEFSEASFSDDSSSRVVPRKNESELKDCSWDRVDGLGPSTYCRMGVNMVNHHSEVESHINVNADFALAKLKSYPDGPNQNY